MRLNVYLMSVSKVGDVRLKRPSDLCGGCKLYGEQCHCLCHDKELVYGKHEILWQMPASPIIHPEDD